MRSLPFGLKLLWIYLCDSCDYAGVWDVFPQQAELHTGYQYDWETVIDGFNGKVIQVDTDKWFIPDFIAFQYGALNEKNRVHNSIIKRLEKLGIRQAPSKGLGSPYEAPSKGALVRAKDKELLLSNTNKSLIASIESHDNSNTIGWTQEVRFAEPDELFKHMAKIITSDKKKWDYDKSIYKLSDVKRDQLNDWIRKWTLYLFDKTPFQLTKSDEELYSGMLRFLINQKTYGR